MPRPARKTNPAPPRCSFSALQIKSRRASITLADRLLTMQTKSGRFKDAAGNKTDLVMQAQLVIGLLQFAHNRGAVTYAYGQYDINKYITAALTATAWLLRFLHKKGQSKNARAYAKYISGDKIDNTAACLLAIARVVQTQVYDKWRPGSPFQLSQDLRFYQWGELLARYLHSKRRKDGTWPGSDPVLIISALFAWIELCRVGWAYYPELKTNETYSFINRDRVYQSLMQYIKLQPHQPRWLQPIPLALAYSKDSAAYRQRLLKRWHKLTQRRRLALAELLIAWNYTAGWQQQYPHEAKLIGQRVNPAIKTMLKKSTRSLPQLAARLSLLIKHAQFAGNFLLGEN